ncbi:MAG: hypothetical protein ACI8PD_001350 [Nitrospinales bacterium]|jgi:hypothetical protein
MKYLERLNIMTTATIKTKVQTPANQNGKAKRSKVAKKSPWIPVTIFLIFAGLVAYLFSPNVPDSQRAGSKGGIAGSGFVGGLGK